MHDGIIKSGDPDHVHEGAGIITREYMHDNPSYYAGRDHLPPEGMWVVRGTENNGPILARWTLVDGYVVWERRDGGAIITPPQYWTGLSGMRLMLKGLNETRYQYGQPFNGNLGPLDVSAVCG